LIDRAFVLSGFAARNYRRALFTVSGLWSGHGKRSITFEGAARPGAFTILVDRTFVLSGFADWGHRALFTEERLRSGLGKRSVTCA